MKQQYPEILKAYHEMIKEIDVLTGIVQRANELNAQRVKESGIDLSSPPLSKKEIVTGETLFDHRGRPWIVGKGKKMIPTFSQTGVQGVQREIIKDHPYPFSEPVEYSWGWSSDLYTFRRKT